VKIRSLFLALSLLLAVSAVCLGQGTRLLRHPTVSRDSIAFEYAGDLWTVSRNGGQARRVTSTQGAEIDPYFSPDGSQIAYTSTVAGNTDVFVVPTSGGDAKRLTYHPGIDRVRGWTPDGRRVIFSSARDSVPQQAYLQLWTVGLDGGLPERLPMPRAFSASYSPDGRRLAYDEITMAFIPQWYEASMWRYYRGGRTQPIKVINLSDYSVEKLPWTNSNDSLPMWIGNTIYFLSDRNHTMNLFAYSSDTKQVKQLTNHDDFDIMTASAGSDAIVYEQAGYIYLVEAKSGKAQRLDVQVTGDLPWARPQFKKVISMIRNSALSPTGVRAAFEARGEIFTVPAEKGDYRNLTQTSGAHDRNPTWSPDGNQLAWLSDVSGEYQLMIGDPLGITTPRAIGLPSTAFYSAPTWSPDGTQILLQDNHRNLWTIEVTGGKATKIDTDNYPDPSRSFEARWAPDSKWITYSKNLPNRLRAIFIYSLADKKSHQITDGMADSISAAFDAGGKYLYFMASTNYGPSTGWLEMSSIDRPVRRAIYLVVLAANEPSPLLPETGDEPPPKPSPPAEAPPPQTPPAAPRPVNVRIDFDGIGQRIISVNIPAGDYSNLTAGAAGSFYYTEPILTTAPGPASLRLQRYQLKERTAAPFLEGIRSYSLSADKKKLLYQGSAGGGTSWGIVPTDRPAPVRVGDGPLNVAQLEMKVDPRAEWENIFRETWRIQREYFYDPKFHGADWQAIYEKYRPLVAHVGHRADLSYLIATVGGELAVGHSYLTGTGDVPGEDPVSVGLLGADIAVENGRYRIKRIYTGENWNPDLRAPLSAPGTQVSEGDYLLEVNGRQLVPPTNLYSMFEGTAGRQTLIRVSKNPSMEASRVVTVIPIPSEDGLRTRAWVEDNRRTVDKLSNGRLAYVWLPNTGGSGYTYFTRYYYAQQHKDGAIIDERYNQGGQVADYIVNELDRKLMGYFAQRDGEPATSPTAGIYGPKVMIINESAGSGGDALPYMFHQRKLGPLIGTRTWGGLVGTLGFPPTIDGGGITAPNLAFYDLSGKWAVENEGVPPDIEVEYTPAEVIKGRDPQLERAVQEALKLLERSPTRKVPRPAPINRVSNSNRVSKTR
jgi:tricorn protease